MRSTTVTRAVRALGVMVAVFTIGSATRARAEQPVDARKDAAEHAERARVLFNVGRFDDAAAEYERAYEETASPDLLFNIAQCYRQAPNLAKAIFFYKSYLNNAPNADRADIQQKIARLQQLQEEQAKARPTNAPRAPAVETPAPAPQPAPTPASSATAPPRPPAPEETAAAPAAAVTLDDNARAVDAGHGHRVAGLALLGVGGALIVGGVVGSILATQATSDLRAATAAHAPFDPSIQSRGQAAVVAESVLYAAGGLAAVVGTTLYLVGRSERRRALHASIAPAVGRAQAGVVVSGAF